MVAWLPMNTHKINESVCNNSHAIHVLSKYSLPVDFGKQVDFFIIQLCQTLDIPSNNLTINETFIRHLDRVITNYVEKHHGAHDLLSMLILFWFSLNRTTGQSGL